MLNKLQHGTCVSATATGSTATATITGVSGAVMYITDVAGSSDKAGAIMAVKQGSTTVWEVQIATSAAGINAFQHTFAAPLVGAVGADVSVVVDGTTTAKANISAIYL